MRVSLTLNISDGMVSCPRRNTMVDVEECLACAALSRLRGGGLTSGSIACKPDLKDVISTGLLS